MEDFVAVVWIHGLLHAAHVDAGQPPDGNGEGAVAARIIDRPVGAAVQPVAAASAAAEAAARRIH